MRLPFIFVLASSALLTAGADGRAEPKLSEAQQARWDQAKAILDKAEKVELISVDPTDMPKEKLPKEAVRGFNTFGRTEVKDADLKKKVLAVALAPTPGFGAKCFDPRHAIRVTAGGKSVDIMICFECHWVYVYTGKDDDPIRMTIGNHQEALDKILKDADVPLAPPARK